MQSLSFVTTFTTHSADAAWVTCFCQLCWCCCCSLLPFCLLQGWSAVKGLLQLRELFVGSGSPLSPGRFLFESVGQVHLIKWTPEGGSQVVPLNAAEIEQELSLLAPTNNQQLTAAGAAAKAAEQQAQEVGGLAAAPAAAAGGAAGALMNSLRAWLDHHHRYVGIFCNVVYVGVVSCRGLGTVSLVESLGWFCGMVGVEAQEKHAKLPCPSHPCRGV